MGNENTTKSYLDPPQLKGVKNSDGTYTLSGADLQGQRDFNYYVAKMLQGGLNLANLNKDTNEVFTGMVTFTDLSDPNSTTVIDGGHITTGSINADLITTGSLNADLITTGTLTGITLNSTGQVAEIEISEGNLQINDTTPYPYKNLYAYVGYSGYDGKVHIDTTVPLKLISSSGISIDTETGGKVYIGTNASYSGDVDIGHAGGRINLDCDVYYKGVLLT